MDKIKSHKDLNIWQESMDLVIEIYKTSESFPNHEVYGLIAQIRRATVSIPLNISEGAGRKGEKNLVDFYLLH